jgi:hypothetical protein
MSIDDGLHKLAADYAVDAKNRAARLHSEATELEIKVVHLRSQGDAASLAPKRLSNYQVKIGVDYQFSRCWIDNERRSPLVPEPGGGAGRDFFRCDTCGGTFDVPVRF